MPQAAPPGRAHGAWRYHAGPRRGENSWERRIPTRADGGFPARVVRGDDGKTGGELGHTDDPPNASTSAEYAKRIADRLRGLRDGLPPLPTANTKAVAAVTPTIRRRAPIAEPQPVTEKPEPVTVELESEPVPGAVDSEEREESFEAENSAAQPAEGAATTEAPVSPGHHLLAAAEHGSFQTPEPADSPSSLASPAGPSPLRVRSPTARYWSRPHWQDVAAAAAGQSIGTPERAWERHEPERRQPESQSPSDDLEPAISRRSVRPLQLPLTPGLNVGPGCPYLGLIEDPSTHFTFSHPEHIGFALGRSAAVDFVFQGTHCLTEEYPHCARFFAAEERSGRQVASAQDPLTPFSLETPELVYVTGQTGAQPRSQVARWLMAGIVVLLILAATAGLLGAFPAGLAPAGP